MWKRLGRVRCKLLHREAMWPIHGCYECRTCGRRYRVPWAVPERDGATGAILHAGSCACEATA